MAYNGGCIIGVELVSYIQPRYIARDGQIIGQTPNALNSESTTTTANWTGQDGAFTPSQDASASAPYGTPYASAFAYVTAASGTFALLAEHTPPGTQSPYNVTTFAKSSGASYSFAKVAADYVAADAMFSNHRRHLAFNFGAAQYVGVQYSSVVSSTYRGAEWGEVAGADVVEIPNNQDLVSYKRQRTAPTYQEVKTLDGVKRRVITGPASTTFAATWQWSDNGQTAATLDKILAKAAETIAPLVVYIPAGIYYNGPFLDLVIPTNEPAVIMPAPGVYSLTIEGTCQP